MVYGFVYLWFDRLHKKFCIGSHYGQLDDGYITSTGHMTSAYKARSSDFRRRVLWTLTSPDLKMLQHKEQAWLNLIDDTQLGKKYYNLKKLAAGGNGGANKGKTVKKHGPCTDDHKAKLRACQLKNNARSKRIMIDGIAYSSLREAAETLGISRSNSKLSCFSNAKCFA